MNENKLETLSERLEYIMESQNLNNTTFSKLINVSKSHVGKIINGQNKPSISLIDKICLELCINKEWLLNGTGEIYKEQTSVEYQKAFNKFNKLDKETQHFLLDMFDKLLELETKLKK